MRKLSYCLIALIFVDAAMLHAETGMYPYVKAHYEEFQVNETWEINDVVFEEHSGAFFSKYERRWQSDILYFTAINNSNEGKCVKVSFKPFGTSLDWASSWGNGKSFYIKKRGKLRNFAGITATSRNYGLESGLRLKAWTPLKDKNCAGPEKPAAPRAR